MKHKKMFGKIFKSRFGPQLVVSIADRDIVAEVLRAEGVAPQRANMESWKEYRDMRGRSTGLISAWEPFRRADLLFLNSFSQCLPSVVILLLWFFFFVFQWKWRLAEDAQRAQTTHHAAAGRGRLLGWRQQGCRWPGEENWASSLPALWQKHCLQCEWPVLQICHGRLVMISFIVFFLKKVFKNWIVDVLQVLIWLK